MDFRKKPLLIGIIVFVLGIPVIFLTTDWDVEGIVEINPIGLVFFAAGIFSIMYGLKSDKWSGGGA